MGVALLTLLIGGTYLLFVRHPVARVGRGRRRRRGRGARGRLDVRARDYQKSAHPRRRRSRRAIRSPRATRPRSRGSRSARAVSSATATWRARRRSCASCPRSTPTSPSRCSPRSGASSAARDARALPRRCSSGASSSRATRRTTSARMLAIGVVGILFWPAVINVAMVLGLAPGDRRAAAAVLVRRLGAARDAGRARPAHERLDAPLHLLDALADGPRRARADRPRDRRVLRHGQDADRRELGHALHEATATSAARSPAGISLKGVAAYLQYKLGVLDIRAWTADAMLAVPRRERARARARGARLVRRARRADHLPGGRGDRARAPKRGPRRGDRLGRDQVRREAARRAARHQAHPLHAPRGRARPLHGPRDRADLLRGGQDLLAPAADRGAERSTSRRAGSTPTRSPTCRCSSWSATRS